MVALGTGGSRGDDRLLVVTVILPEPANIQPVPAEVADMEILLGEDSLEMLEDLEFYDWIDMLEQENDVG